MARQSFNIGEMRLKKPPEFGFRSRFPHGTHGLSPHRPIVRHRARPWSFVLRASFWNRSSLHAGPGKHLDRKGIQHASMYTCIRLWFTYYTHVYIYIYEKHHCFKAPIKDFCIHTCCSLVTWFHNVFCFNTWQHVVAIPRSGRKAVGFQFILV